MHIDLDGNDYYIWKSITVVKPIIVIVEYNAIFGIDRPISVIYSDTFNRSNAHYSNLLFDSSLRSLVNLASEKGYSFIGCNIAGNNVYFIRNDKLNDDIKPVSLSHGYIASKYRESRDKNGVLTYLSKEDSMALLPGMSVFNTDLNCVEPF
jgi:hypothetical protein